MNHEIITLNVGGTKFKTLIATLEVSYFFEALLTKWSKSNVKGSTPDEIFVDRNPNIFSYVLDIWREEIEFEDVPEKYQTQVAKQLRYFGIEMVEEKVERKKFKIQRSVIWPKQTVERISLFLNSQDSTRLCNSTIIGIEYIIENDVVHQQHRDGVCFSPNHSGKLGFIELYIDDCLAIIPLKNKLKSHTVISSYIPLTIVIYEHVCVRFNSNLQGQIYLYTISS